MVNKLAFKQSESEVAICAIESLIKRKERGMLAGNNIDAEDYHKLRNLRQLAKEVMKI